MLTYIIARLYALAHKRLQAQLTAFIILIKVIMDIQERVPLLVSALRVVPALVSLSSLRVLVTEPTDDSTGRSVAELLESLSNRAGAESLPPYTAFLGMQIRFCIKVINGHGERTVHSMVQLAKGRYFFGNSQASRTGLVMLCIRRVVLAGAPYISFSRFLFTCRASKWTQFAAVQTARHHRDHIAHCGVWIETREPAGEIDDTSG